MTRIRLLHAFACGHQELPAGLVIGINDAEIVRRLILVELAEYADPQTAVISPSEIRVDRIESVRTDFEATASYGPPKRRGRPRKIPENLSDA